MVPPPRDVAPGQRHLPGRGERRFNCQFVGINDDVRCTGRVVDEFTGNLTDGFSDGFTGEALGRFTGDLTDEVDRKSTRLNSSHVKISYAVFCLKKKKQIT